MLADTKKSKYAALHAPACEAVQWTGGFWKDVVTACATHMVPQLQHMFEAKEISHVVENFRICAGDAEGDFDGTVFGDGDFYKWMESQLFSAVALKDVQRLEGLDAYIDLIGRAQQSDGYLSTKQIIENAKGQENARMRDINEFEVYNMGHLFTSACLHHRITGKKNFLEIAERAAAYLQKLYNDAEKNNDVQTAVCPSHYMGLIELYRTTGKQAYLDLAQKAIVLRDAVKNGMDDNQDRLPLKEHEKIIGHAVRATYLYAGVADLFAEEGEEDYRRVLHSVWRNMVDTKMYLTGGIGALYNGTSPYGNFFVDQKVHQAFGYEYQLPNVTAYNETCASIGLVMWAYRMFLIEPKAEYMDVLERAMLNVNLAAVSLDGKRYFYENMLRRAKELKYELIWPLTRSEYILSYCCPPNLARALMQSSEYAYAACADGVYTGMYGESEAHFSLENGADFVLRQETAYPYEGRICFTIPEAKEERPVRLFLRIPGWCESGSLTVEGKRYELTKEHRGTYQEVVLEHLAGAEVVLDLAMPVRLTIANPMVEEDTSQAAVERGPLVYCMESFDCDLPTLDDLYLDPVQPFETGKMKIEDRTVGTLTGSAVHMVRSNYDASALYQTLGEVQQQTVPVRLIPYFAWDNRGMGEMRIWLPYRL